MSQAEEELVAGALQVGGEHAAPRLAVFGAQLVGQLPLVGLELELDAAHRVDVVLRVLAHGVDVVPHLHEEEAQPEARRRHEPVAVARARLVLEDAVLGQVLVGHDGRVVDVDVLGVDGHRLAQPPVQHDHDHEQRPPRPLAQLVLQRRRLVALQIRPVEVHLDGSVPRQGGDQIRRPRLGKPATMRGHQRQRLNGGYGHVGRDIPHLVEAPVVVLVGQLVELGLPLHVVAAPHAKLIVHDGKDHVDDDELGRRDFVVSVVVYARKLSTHKTVVREPVHTNNLVFNVLGGTAQFIYHLEV